MTADWITDLARLAEAIPSEEREWTYQAWGEQNQNGDHADSILYDGRGETIVYELPNDVGEFIAAANPATILRLIADLREWHRVAASNEAARNEARIERDRLRARLAAVGAEAATHDRGRGECACTLCAVLSAAPTDTTKEN